ncbi:MAG: substrate-binding domain-containing protein [Actinobacteria bacterium]|nr:substrate-binding domain-containing protein [Actinomycetota bacterium]
MKRSVEFRPFRHWRLALSIGGAILILGIALAACGGGSSSSGTSGEKTEASAGEGGESGGSANVEEARAGAEAAEKGPTKWEGPTEPVKEVPKISAAVIPCASSLVGCSENSEAFQEAGEALGWNVKDFNVEYEPAKWNKAIIEAVNEGREAIVVSSTPAELISQGLKAAEEAEVPVLSLYNGDAPPNPKAEPGGRPWTFSDVAFSFPEATEADVNFITAESNGEGSVLTLEDKSSGGIVIQNKLLREKLGEICPGCSETEMTTSAAEAETTAPQKIVAFLQSHPEIGWVVCWYDGQSYPLARAIQQAGLPVKVLGEGGEPRALKLVRNGEVIAADLRYENNYAGWQAADTMLRQLNGQELPVPKVPLKLFTKRNAPPEGAAPWEAPFDFRGEFKKLWGIGG